MLLQELYDKPTKPWRQVSKEQKAALYAKIYKGKKNVAAAEVASQLNKMGYIVSARTVDKDQEKPEFKAHDYNRPVGTKIETRAKVANKAKNESVDSIVLAARALKEGAMSKCDKLKAELEELEAHKKSLAGDDSSKKGRAELTAKIKKLKAELQAESK